MNLLNKWKRNARKRSSGQAKKSGKKRKPHDESRAVFLSGLKLEVQSPIFTWHNALLSPLLMLDKYTPAADIEYGLRNMNHAITRPE